MSMNTAAPVISAGEVLWIAFGILAIFSILVTLAFYYHWGRFAPTHFGAVVTTTVYTVGLAVLGLGMLGILASL